LVTPRWEPWNDARARPAYYYQCATTITAWLLPFGARGHSIGISFWLGSQFIPDVSYFLLNDLVCSLQYGLRDCEPDLLRGLEVDYQ
jgi:hypothetical protein